ncbi:RNA-binding domain-containing protein [Martensiomyces pterosporus]|nr:RNA-binding domain-containing protein [Martensiomyces pterosporus]
MDYRRDTRESHIVFVGNVPFDTTEEQLIGILRQAGPVIEFRLVFDRDTGKQRGYGFCEYADAKIASSAVKNLSGTPVSGRPMKLDFADREVVRRQFGTDGLSLSGGSGGMSANREAFNNSAHVSQTANAPVGPEQVRQVMEELTEQQKTELVAQFKTFAQRNLRVARTELVENPALAHALFNALVSLNLADGSKLMRIKTSAMGSDYAMTSGSVRPLVPPPPIVPPNPGAAPTLPMRPPPPPPPMAARISLPPQSSVPAGAPPPAHAPVPAPAPAPAPEPAPAGLNNEQVLLQLMSLTDEQLAQLPPEHRKQIMELKQQLQGAQ